MQKIAAVEQAKALMNEAKEWSVWHWLLEKRRVRAAADEAVDALRREEKRVKACWSEDLKKAYRELEVEASGNGNRRRTREYEKAKQEARNIAPQTKSAAERVKEADDTAEAARLDAEAIFDEAERHLSASMAREGAQRAIESWELIEKAIRKAEAAAKKN